MLYDLQKNNLKREKLFKLDSHIMYTEVYNAKFLNLCQVNYYKKKKQ